MFEHRSTASRLALRGSVAVAGGALMLGMGGTAFASGGHNQGQMKGSDEDNASQSLVDASHNNIPIQACHDQVPVNVLGVQVPVSDAEAALGLGAGGNGTAPQHTDKSCDQPAAQQN